MVFNANCAFQTCQEGCCNYYGSCPEDYDQQHFSSYYTRCYHYYEEPASNKDQFVTYLVVAVGAVLLLLTLCYRKRKAIQKINILSNINHSARTQNPYNPDNSIHSSFPPNALSYHSDAPPAQPPHPHPDPQL